MASAFRKCCPQITEQLVEERALKMLPVLITTTGKHSWKKSVSEKGEKIKIWQMRTDCGWKLVCPKDGVSWAGKSERIYIDFRLPFKELYFEEDR